MMTSQILCPEYSRDLADRARLQVTSREAQLLQLHEYAALLPKLSDVVLSTTPSQQDAIHESINQSETGVASIERLHTTGISAVSYDEEDEALLSAITSVKNNIQQLRSRAEEVCGRLLESVETIRPLLREEQFEIASRLKEKRADFWAKLYQLPFVQETIIDGLSRIARGDGQARKGIFFSPSEVSSDDKALQEVELRERAQSVLERLRAIPKDLSLSQARIEISLLLRETPVTPEKSLALCGEFRRMAAELAGCEGQLLCAYETLEEAKHSGDLRFERWRTLRDACGGTALETRVFLRELTEIQDPYLRLKDYLVLSSLGLVGAWSRGRPSGRYDPQDLFQRGVLGLMKGIERFDPHLGFSFSTLSVSHIRSEIQDEREASRYAVKVSEKAIQALRSLSNKHSEEATAGSFEEIQSGAGVSQEEALAILPLMQPTRSFDAPVGGTKDISLVALHGDVRAVSPFRAVHQEDVRVAVQRAISTLSAEHQEIVGRHFGLANYERMTDEEIGKIFGRSTEQIRQKRLQALRMLQRSKYSVALKKMTSND